jgi:hypothetical protein
MLVVALLVTATVLAGESPPISEPEQTVRAPEPAPGAKRFVRNRTLVSREVPSMELTVDKRFKSIGSLEFDLKQVARVQRFVFTSGDEWGVPTRLLIVQFESILPDAKGSYTFEMENPTRLGAHSYQTSVGYFDFDAVASANPGAEAERTRAFLAERGWNVSGETFVVARYARIVDDAKRSELIVFYLENLRTHGLTRDDLVDGGRGATVLGTLLHDVAARSRMSFKIRDTKG